MPIALQKAIGYLDFTIVAANYNRTIYFFFKNINAVIILAEEYSLNPVVLIILIN